MNENTMISENYECHVLVVAVLLIGFALIVL